MFLYIFELLSSWRTAWDYKLYQLCKRKDFKLKFGQKVGGCAPRSYAYGIPAAPPPGGTRTPFGRPPALPLHTGAVKYGWSSGRGPVSVARAPVALTAPQLRQSWPTLCVSAWPCASAWCLCVPTHLLSLTGQSVTWSYVGMRVPFVE